MRLSGFSLKAFGAGAIFIAAFFALTDVLAAAPSFRWAQRAGGANRDYGTRIAVDLAGNSHVIGRFDSTNAFFGPFTLTNGGLFVAKYDVGGNAVWAKPIAITFNAGFDENYSIGADRSGNTYISGWFFAPGSITFEGVTLTNDFLNEPDLFLAKYDAAGNLSWARKAGPAGATNSIRALAFVPDADGNCYVTGDYVGAPSMGLTNLTDSVGLYSAKFDTDGNLVWARTMTTIHAPIYFRAIALGSASDYYVSGTFIDDTITFGTVTLTNGGSGGSIDIFTVRYDSAGNLLWAKRSGSAGNDNLTGLGVDAAGDCYLHSYGPSSVSFGDCAVTEGGYCLAKYDQNGNTLWCKSISTNANPLRCAVDTVGNSYIFGAFDDVADLDGITLTNARSPGYPLNFILKLDPDGRALWAKQFGGADNEADWTQKSGIAVDAAGNCSVTGFIRLTNAMFDSFTLSPMSNDEDVFVARLDADPPRLDVFRVANTLVLFWPTNQPGFALEHANGLPPTNGWSPVTNPVTGTGLYDFVTNPITAGSRFYRLRKH